MQETTLVKKKYIKKWKCHKALWKMLKYLRKRKKWETTVILTVMKTNFEDFHILPAEKSTYFDIWAKHGFQRDTRKGAIVKNQTQNKKTISI